VIAEREAGLGGFIREVARIALDQPNVRTFFDLQEVESQLKQKVKTALDLKDLNAI
jgi:hypothetical protein